MASRQEEKEARRQARIEQEEAERRAASRSKRLQMVFGGLLAAGVIAAVIIFVFASGGDSNGSGNPTEPGSNLDVKLPPAKITDEKEAAKAAGCTLNNPPDEGRSHEDKTFTAKDYDTNPPTSGDHFPQWAQDGIYTEKTVPQVGMLVHTLEHGRIDVQYKPGTDAQSVKQLEAFLAESDSGYHMLLYPNTTGMDAAVAATAWDHSLTCPTMNDKVFDALRTFRIAHIDRGPEKVA
jgi:hypothetical protein